jgi:hypothetical protein
MRATSNPTLRHTLRTSGRFRAALATLLASSALVSAMVFAAPGAGAATPMVTNCNSTGSGSLADVVGAAPAGSTVTFSVTCPSSSPITLTSTINLIVPVTIDGPGAGAVVVDGSGATAFEVSSNVTGVGLTGLTIENAVPAVVNFGTLTLSDCTMTGNLASTDGGAVENDGDLTISSSTFTQNAAAAPTTGGAIESSGGSVTITGSTISDNNVGIGSGGGIENDAGTMSIVDTTISGNTANGPGGGIYNAGTMSVTDSTVAHNTGVRGGGGINNVGSMSVTDSTISLNNVEGGGGGGILNTGTLVVTASTLTQNSHRSVFRHNGGGGIKNVGGSVTLAATVLAETSPFDCFGAITDAGYNLDDDGSCGFSATNHSLSGVKPHFGPLQDNGGPTETEEPALGSPVLNDIPMGATANSTTLCPSTDQRGVARPQASACDIGAVELSATPQDITSADQVTVPARQPFSFTITTTGAPTPSISIIGNPPRKLTFADNGNGTATISGRAKQVGSSAPIIKATFGSGSTQYVVLQVLTLTVTSAS